MTESPSAIPADNAGVLVRPPLLYLAALLILLLLRWLWPLPIFDHAGILWPGVALMVVSVAFGVWGRTTLARAGTSVNPGRPTTTIVASGPYRWSRNPLYVCLAFLFLGITLTLNTWWGILVLVPVLALMHFGVILREERYLDRKFGEIYRDYRSRVRRYL
jgi:protein-S-isoprenylcysteine O-methyltransferase Ste14